MQDKIDNPAEMAKFQKTRAEKKNSNPEKIKNPPKRFCMM